MSDEYFDGKDFRDFSVVDNVDGGVTRFYKVCAANEGQLNMLEKLFVYIQYLGVIGASRHVNLYVDGDGAVSFSFSSHGSDDFVFRDLDFDTVMDKDSGYGKVSVEENDKDSFFDLG